MPIIRCLINGCKSDIFNSTLFSFPKSSAILKIWCEIVAPHHSKHSFVPDDAWLRPRLAITQKVCIRHFEAKYLLNKNGKTVRKHSSVPTLFTPEEIELGRPNCTLLLSDGKNLDHNYSAFSSTGHDHTYARNSKPSVKLTKVTWDTQDKPASDIQATDGVQDKEESTNDVDDDVTNEMDPNDPEDEETSEAVFSWQKQDILYPTEDTDVLCPKAEPGLDQTQELGELSLYEDAHSHPGAARDPTLEKHAEYQCNVCHKEIIGFRYTCIQCADWDLCAACEARAAHTAHYMLRVPGPRPYNEIQTVMAAIRQQLLSENLFLSELITEDCVKSEPEDAAPEPDPLQAPPEDGELTDGSEYMPPPRKRRRRPRSSDSEDSSDCDSARSRSVTPIGKRVKLTDRTRLAANTTRPQHAPTIQDFNQPETPLPDSICEVPNDLFKVPSDIFKVPSAIRQVTSDIYQVTSDIFEVPSEIFQGQEIVEVPSDLFGVPGYFIQVESEDVGDVEPLDETTVYVDDTAVDIDPISTGVTEVGVASEIDDHTGIMYLKVPPDTNHAAVAQALQSKAYVLVQPLAIEELNGAER